MIPAFLANGTRMSKFLVALAVLVIAGISSAIASDGGAIEMTRAEATEAFNAIAQIGQYQVVAKQGGQEVATTKFLDVSLAMRSTLIRDTSILRSVALETGKLQEQARARLADDKAYNAELVAISQQKVPIDGLIRFSETDLQLDKNPQITPIIGSFLVVLEAK